ncbi:hypothetical protein B566_EDAN016857 [Ephemera danica]|nr:hypothetical protein B566_EDAN016857 [Ephemera danica]
MPTRDKPHACELCHKRFALACNLRAHMKTHEGDPQEECVRCGKVFLASATQIAHGFCSGCFQESPSKSLGDSGSDSDEKTDVSDSREGSLPTTP